MTTSPISRPLQHSPGHASARLRTAGCAMALGLSIVVLLAATTDEFGWTSDEVYYFLSAEYTNEWFKALAGSFGTDNFRYIVSREIVDEYWLWDTEHNPHPPLYKIFSGITLAACKKSIGELAAFRLSAQLHCAVLAAALFISLAGRYSIPAALCGSACMLFMPRLFGHAHFGTTEFPLMALWFLCICAFWRGRASRRYPAVLALLWGMALATKFTAVLIILPLATWAIVYRDRRSIRNLLLMALCAPLVAVLLTPGWWFDPLSKIQEFLAATLSRKEHIPIPTYYFGTASPFRPHWSYAPVMTLLTIPASTLLLAVIGMYQLIRTRAHRMHDVLFFLTIPIFLLVTMLPGTPVHDGVRQFIYIMPFVAYFAGTGFAAIVTRLAQLISVKWLRTGIAPALLLIAVLYPAAETARIHPFELSYYNRLIGGLHGAYRRGMEVTYWYDTLNRDMLGAINQLVPQGAAVSSWPMAAHYFEFLQEHGKIRKDIRFITPSIKATGTRAGARLDFSPERPNYLVLVCRFGTFNDFYWRLFRKNVPLFGLQYEGVPLAALYRWNDITL